jgi:hypothetical protein
MAPQLQNPAWQKNRTGLPDTAYQQHRCSWISTWDAHSRHREQIEGTSPAASSEGRLAPHLHSHDITVCSPSQLKLLLDRLLLLHFECLTAAPQ